MQTEERYGLPRGLLVAIKNAGEKSGPLAVSPRGAKGVMQFMDDTRTGAGGKYDHDPFNPVESIDAGGRFLRDLLREYNNDVWAVIAHYNGGYAQARAVQKGLEPPSKETQGYLRRIAAYHRQTSPQAVAQR